MNKIVGGISFAILLLPIFTFVEVFAQVVEQGGNNTEGTPTKMTKELSCEISSDTGLLCSNSELGLCVLRTDLSEVGGGNMWNIMNPMLCEAGG